MFDKISLSEENIFKLLFAIKVEGGVLVNQDKMYLINKIFNNETIRTVWDNANEKYYISVIDVIAVLSGSLRPRKYWSDLKKKLYDEGSKVSDYIGQLKLKSLDGKYRLTDVTDISGMFRIIESIPSKNAEPIKQWLARLGSERIDEVFNPSLAAQRAIDTYRTKGYDEAWIAKRIKGIQERKKLTDVWKDNGIESNLEYAILTNDIYKEWSGMSAKEYKEFKGLRKESLRDNMSDIEIALADIGELTTRELAKKHKPVGLTENRKIAKEGGQVASNTRKDIEARLGETVVTKDNALSYQYIDDKSISSSHN